MGLKVPRQNFSIKDGILDKAYSGNQGSPRTRKFSEITAGFLPKFFKPSQRNPHEKNQKSRPTSRQNSSKTSSKDGALVRTLLLPGLFRKARRASRQDSSGNQRSPLTRQFSEITTGLLPEFFKTSKRNTHKKFAELKTDLS